MDVRNADSLPRVGVCFCRDESLSALAVVYRGVGGPVRFPWVRPAASCLLPPVSLLSGIAASGRKGSGVFHSLS